MNTETQKKPIQDSRTVRIDYLQKFRPRRRKKMNRGGVGETVAVDDFGGRRARTLQLFKRSLPLFTLRPLFINPTLLNHCHEPIVCFPFI